MGERHRRHEGGGQVRSLELRGEVRRTVGVLSAQRHKAGGTPKAESVGREEGEVQVQVKGRQGAERARASPLGNCEELDSAQPVQLLLC